MMFKFILIHLFTDRLVTSRILVTKTCLLLFPQWHFPNVCFCSLFYTLFVIYCIELPDCPHSVNGITVLISSLKPDRVTQIQKCTTCVFLTDNSWFSITQGKLHVFSIYNSIAQLVFTQHLNNHRLIDCFSLLWELCRKTF